MSTVQPPQVKVIRKLPKVCQSCRYRNVCPADANMIKVCQKVRGG